VEDADGGLRVAAATAGCIAGTIAFAVYTRTLLPGVDLGDTGGFQAAVLWPETSARQGYPLYYALARPFVGLLSEANPARGLNLFSALCAGAAVGLLAFIAGIVARSALAGAAAGLLLAFSYTFWTQAVIAEVYALHLALTAACLIALEAWSRRPTSRRLAAFFAIYALSFGNHLAMILWLPPFALFLLQRHPQPRQLLRPRTVALAAAIALAGTLLYLPNLLFVWTSVDATGGWGDRVSAFWFDTTKADWREAMVLAVGSDRLPARAAMWLWDARQQFGIAGLVLAVAGAVRLWLVSRAWAVLAWTGYAIATVFAVTYNVGDPHVFFLPGHFLAAFCAAAALAPLGTRGRWRIASGLAVAAILYAGWRAWDTWPVADRHRDRRADVLVARLAAGLTEASSVLVSQMDWQAENALLYSARYERRDLAWTRLADVMLHWPFFVRDNHAIGRDVVLTASAAGEIAAAYGGMYPLLVDPIPVARPLSAAATAIPPGTPYVLTLLTPPREERFDEQEFARALETLTGGRGPAAGGREYQVWAGLAGEDPSYHRVSDTPFRGSFAMLGDGFTVRMEAWLPFDTFRRGGFGVVLRGRQRILAVERGVSLAWFSGDGTPASTYADGLYAPKPRLRIPAATPQQAAALHGAILGRATLPR
jgi:hypothetical protein